FFFQAEDGIRDGHVTGVQTCALPICHLDDLRAADLVVLVLHPDPEDGLGGLAGLDDVIRGAPGLIDRDGEANTDRAGAAGSAVRSEERRVGKEGGWWRWGAEY